MSGKDRVRAKWGADVAAAGFTITPSHLLAANAFLPSERHLAPTEMLILLNLLSAWWQADRLPFPSKATLAKRLGLKSTRQVQRALSSLESKGLIQRIERFHESKGRASNYYDLSGTVALVKTLVTEHPGAFGTGKRARVSAAKLLDVSAEDDD